MARVTEKTNDWSTQAPPETPVTILHTVEMANGDKVLDMMSNRIPGAMAVLVDLGTLQRLVDSLIVGNLETIKERFIGTLQEVSNMEYYLFALNEELAFHKTVNMLKTGAFEIR
jgi:hypothetical protein